MLVWTMKIELIQILCSINLSRLIAQAVRGGPKEPQPVPVEGPVSSGTLAAWISNLGFWLGSMFAWYRNPAYSLWYLKSLYLRQEGQSHGYVTQTDLKAALDLNTLTPIMYRWVIVGKSVLLLLPGFLLAFPWVSHLYPFLCVLSIRL